MDFKKNSLYASAKELFATKGFKDTGVADITKKAGVATGTYYNYYKSKDKLFLEILEEETTAMMKGILSSLDMSQPPVKLILRLLTLNMEGMLANPILRQWYDPAVYHKIEKLFREEDGLGKMDFLYRDFIKLVERWQSEGTMRSDIGSDTIMAIFESIIRIGYHREEIGLRYFPAVQDYLTEFVLRGLTDCGAISDTVEG